MSPRVEIIGRSSRYLTLVVALLAGACGEDGGSGNASGGTDSGFGGGAGGDSAGGSDAEIVGGTTGGDPMGGGGGESPIGGVAADAGVDGSTECRCDRGLVCDELGQCVEKAPCEADLECRAGRICVDMACADGCADDAACAGNGVATICADGRCVQCAADVDCFGRSTCDLASHLCIEPAQCDDSRECIPPNICNIRTGGCDAPFDCRVEGMTCMPGLECNPDNGRCRTPENCVDNSNCPLTQVCLPGRPRLCGPCREDDQCDGTQVCLQGECVENEVAPCAADVDCSGNRVCTDGTCFAPPCEDDDSENNDSPDTAEALAGGGAFSAQSCGDDDDYYGFTLPRMTVATVTVNADGLGAELDLQIFDGTGEVVGAGDAGGLVEVAIVGPFLVDRPLVARVYQRGAAGSAGYIFDLGLQASGVECVDDAYDVRSGDDTRETARSLRIAGTPAIDEPLDGKLCEGDDDWLCLSVEDGEDLRVVGSVPSGNLVVSAELYAGDDEMPLQTARWVREGDAMELTRGMRGTFCIRLHAESGEGGYEVRVSTTSRALAGFCAQAEELAFDAGGSAQVSGRLPEEDLVTPSCGSANLGGGEVAYAVTTDAPALLIARVTGEAGGTLGDPMLSAREVCSSAQTELACNDDRYEPDAPYLLEANPAEIRVPLESAGTVTLLVDGTNPGERPDYRLEVELQPLAAAPANDRCVGATDLALQDGLGRIRVNLDRAADDFSANCLPASGPDAVYSVHVESRSRVSAQVYADFASGVYLTSVCGQGEPLGCGTGFDLNDVEAGDYFLVIEGVGPQARGRVQGQVIVEPHGPAPANDSCATAAALDAGGGALDSTTRGARADVQLGEGNACTGDNTSGGDVVFRMPVSEGETYFVEAIPDQGWDLSLLVVGDCAMPVPTCLAGHDGALTERVEFSVGAGVDEVSVIVDGANGESGPFHMTWGPLE